ncbi:MAG: hypothetical protein JKY98_05660 [Gammaproteobacteria bacterium]|nr:hypothetical protein [Gammaproteobacteria bacterium]
MNARMRVLLEKLEELEDELLEELREQGEDLQYHLEGTRVKFDRAVAEGHLKFKTNVIPWFRAASWRNTLSAPFIYSLIVPLALLDLSITIYQLICFRLYQIPAVRRSKYIVLDRKYLSYLNGIEKFNCVYCSYGNGVISYTREIIARTEQYWCPIKHARQPPGVHRHYAKFLDYGDARDYQERALKFREELKTGDK